MFGFRVASPNRHREAGGMEKDSGDGSLVVDPIRVAQACHDPDRDLFLGHDQVTIDDPGPAPSLDRDHGQKRNGGVVPARRPHPPLSRQCCLAPSAKKHVTRKGTQCPQSTLVEADCATRASRGQGPRPGGGRRGDEVGEKEGAGRDH